MIGSVIAAAVLTLSPGNFDPGAGLDTSQVESASEARIAHLFMADDAVFDIAAAYVTPRDPAFAITCDGTSCYAELIEGR
jgi:hypothetical protein